jgi:hypothetical protein
MAATDRGAPGTGSFRDPSGRVFTRGGRLLRQVNPVYAPEYDHLMSSGLYGALTERGLLVAHDETADPGIGPEAYRVLAPERIPFVSYPFEWPFSALKDAALTTLKIARLALEHGMVLKDASAYNVQFRGTEPIFIDTLSFERWEEGTPWVAYRQFCQHFLAPLALMSAVDARLGALSRLFIDGPPLDLASTLLPFSSKLHPALLVHLHLHAKAQNRRGAEPLEARNRGGFSKRSMLGLLDHLERAIAGLQYRRAHGVWADYYANTNYSAEAMADKARLVTRMLSQATPATVWDLGANTGAFSRIAADLGAFTLAFDGDVDAVEQHYQDCRQRRARNIVPLVMDLANPSARMGWNHDERMSLADRGPADVILALGLVHHLSLTNQVPLPMVAEFFAGVTRTLIVEFIPRSDSQVVGMLSRMPKLQEFYTADAFERAFAPYFALEGSAPVRESERRMYLMRNKVRLKADATTDDDVRFQPDITTDATGRLKPDTTSNTNVA